MIHIHLITSDVDVCGVQLVLHLPGSSGRIPQKTATLYLVKTMSFEYMALLIYPTRFSILIIYVLLIHVEAHSCQANMLFSLCLCVELSCTVLLMLCVVIIFLY
jgi:hypothetical protein